MIAVFVWESNLSLTRYVAARVFVVWLVAATFIAIYGARRLSTGAGHPGGDAQRLP